MMRRGGEEKIAEEENHRNTVPFCWWMKAGEKQKEETLKISGLREALRRRCRDSKPWRDPSLETPSPSFSSPFSMGFSSTLLQRSAISSPNMQKKKKTTTAVAYVPTSPVKRKGQFQWCTSSSFCVSWSDLSLSCTYLSECRAVRRDEHEM